MQLPVDTETICFLIGKAREFQVKEEVVIPDSNLSPADDWSLQRLADHKEDPALQEFTSTVEDLEPDQQAALVAIMWIGRGDFDASDWEFAVTTATEQKVIPTGEYLISTPCVSEFLEEGLNLLGFGCD